MKQVDPTEASPGAAMERTIRVDSESLLLVSRLQPGEFAIIDHQDIDRGTAEALAARRPAGVLNAAKSTSGRYPNLGPTILLEAGIPVVDDLGPRIMTLAEGTQIRLDGATVYSPDGAVVAEGIVQTPQTVAAARALAQEGLSTQMEAFVANAVEHLRGEHDLLLGGVGIPKLRTPMAGRHVVVVRDSYNCRQELEALRPYLREHKPVLVGVGAGAAVLLELGLTPDVAIGGGQELSREVVESGAELIDHTGRGSGGGKGPHPDYSGRDYLTLVSGGTQEDAAFLLAAENGAELIVAVGTHNTLVEFLDQGQAEMASTFITRLRVGDRLIGADGVRALYRHRISRRMLTFLVLAGLMALLTAVLVTPAGALLAADAVAGLGGLYARVSTFISALFQ